MNQENPPTTKKEPLRCESAKDKKDLGENKVRGFLRILIKDGKIKNQKISRKGAVGYVRTGGECL